MAGPDVAGCHDGIVAKIRGRHGRPTRIVDLLGVSLIVSGVVSRGGQGGIERMATIMISGGWIVLLGLAASGANGDRVRQRVVPLYHAESDGVE